MALYRFSHGSFDDHHEVILHHDEELTKRQYHTRIKAATRKALEYAIANQEKFTWNIAGRGVSFEELTNRVLEELYLDGFVNIGDSCVAQWHGGGVGDICSDDPSEENSPDLLALIRSIPKSLKKSAREVHNSDTTT